jgi:exodeoxyribonuclease V alpha subunit
MPTHITARLAWHSDGWNGSICKAPEKNTYCVGCKSYPGDVIARERKLDLERPLAGRQGDQLEGYVPPCSYSYNAFGTSEVPSASNPPDFFFGGATRREWSLPPATVCVWPYEAMYAEEVKSNGYLDNDKRRALTREFFEPIERDAGKNLVFYYANYSNPLSEEEAPRYVLIGVSRIVSVGEELFYENVDEKIAERYAGGIVWARNITAAFPDEGVRLPYHRYIDDPERLAEIALVPEDPRLCKYGSKHLTDDEAIGLLEQFLDKIRVLRGLKDTSEDWDARERWVLERISSLWRSRGLYPGLLNALNVAGATALVDRVKKLAIDKGQQEAHAAAFEVLDKGNSNALSTGLSAPELKQLSRNWKLQDEGSQLLIREVLPRLDLPAEVMARIASERRADSGLCVSADKIKANPYFISELFCDAVSGEVLPWSTVDRGIFPSPDLGGTPLAGVELNDERRFRALCVEHLRREPKHTFRVAKELVVEIAQRMERLPAWKQSQFSERYFAVDAEFLAETLTLRPTEAGLAVYIKTVFDDERLLENTLGELMSRGEISLRRPVTQADWYSWVHKSDSVLAAKASAEYSEAAREQAQICARLFRLPLSVVTGPAGTGKTTVIEALVRGVRRAEGEGAAVLVLAPTGKATDRAREVFEKASLQGVETVTVHSFLASKGWLNDNLTFKRSGGKKAAVGTLILDETSMLDLQLAAALFRAIDWQQVRRLVLVGDPGQLPPIGRGRVFADVIKWMASDHAPHLGKLTRNLRQLLNKVHGEGTAIVALSELFVVSDDDKALDGADDSSTRLAQEQLIAHIHGGGEVDKDLDVIYWDKPEDLSDVLLSAVEKRMTGGGGRGERRPYEVWRDALGKDPTAFQVLTPHRGEMHGVEALNDLCQKHVSQFVLDRIGVVDGVTLSDKVIQIKNRPRSNQIWAYDWLTRKNVKIEVFNGEIGIAKNIGFDTKLWNTVKTGYGPRLKRFCVEFTRKPGLSVGYGKDVPHGGGTYKLSESVEENLELAYAISIHKAQGSEFSNTFVIIPSSAKRPVSTELVYTALTRASKHSTLLIQRDVNSLLDARRRENAQTPQINSYLFELHIASEALANRRGWYEAGKIHEALSGDMLRSKSEVIIANMLHEREIPFRYEQPLFAGDGTIRLPDFTISWAGKTYYWEHLGRLDMTDYASDWKVKQAWYDRWFAGQLVTTEEGAKLSADAAELIARITANRH